MTVSMIFINMLKGYYQKTSYGRIFFNIYPYETMFMNHSLCGVKILGLKLEVRNGCKLCFEYHNEQCATGFSRNPLLLWDLILSWTDSIFVRVYESRIDLLRAVIIGAEGTPYHDGLFFFDVFFPSGYSHVPPVCGWGYYIWIEH